MGALGKRLIRVQRTARHARLRWTLPLHRRRYDLDAARGMLLIMARLSTRQETGIFDSHPAGPERLAAYDASVARLRATGGRVPVRPEG
jgi:hypothetical protein